MFQIFIFSYCKKLILYGPFVTVPDVFIRKFVFEFCEIRTLFELSEISHECKARRGPKKCFFLYTKFNEFYEIKMCSKQILQN
jgi:hypothetical protein